MVIPYLSVGFSCLFLILPIRSVLKTFSDSNQALEENVLYEDKFIGFPTDYDKENPLTSKAGAQREIIMKILEA
jgi:hypothetical protein